MRSTRRLGTWVLTGLILAGSAVGRAQEPGQTEGRDTAARTQAKARASGRRGGPLSRAHQYMGRPIADVMSYLGADWLFRAEREFEEQPEKMLDSLEIKPGMTVADVGAGAGYNTLRLARRVGPKGKVLATDLQPEMLAMLQKNVKLAGVADVVQPIQCTQTDPKLPEGAVDLIMMVDVYHECTNPDAALEAWKRALKPGGRIVFVEYRAEDPTVPIKPEHKMTLKQVRKEVEPHGLTFQESKEFLPWQHIIIFEKPKLKAEQAESKTAEDENTSK